MKPDTFIGCLAIFFICYGLVSFLLDARRAGLAIVRGLGRGIMRIVNTLAYYWRTWVQDRERRRGQRETRLLALMVQSGSKQTEIIDALMLELASLKAARDEDKPPTTIAIAVQGN